MKSGAINWWHKSLQFTANLSLLNNFLKTKLRSYEIPKEFIRVNEIQNGSKNWKNET